MKGWYGNKQKHALASKGVRSKRSLSTMEREDRVFWLEKEMELLKSRPESINWEEVDEIYDSMGIGKKPKEYSEYNSRTLIKLWNIHYKMFNNISSWGGDATDHYEEMTEIQEELAKKGYEPSGEFSQEGNMKFMAKGFDDFEAEYYEDEPEYYTQEELDEKHGLGRAGGKFISKGYKFHQLTKHAQERAKRFSTEKQREEEEFDFQGTMIY